MSADPFGDLLVRSLLTGALAIALVQLCPRSWRGRFRLAVPVAAFAALVSLAVWPVLPVDRFSVEAPNPLAGIQANLNPGAWMIGLWIAGAIFFFARQAWGFSASEPQMPITKCGSGRRLRMSFRQAANGGRPSSGREGMRRREIWLISCATAGRIRRSLIHPLPTSW